MIEKSSNNTKLILINNELDIIIARMWVREVARDMGFDTIDQARISLAASELARVLAGNSDSRSKCEIIVSGIDTDGRLGIKVESMHHHNTKKATIDSSNKEQINAEDISKAIALVDEGFVNAENGHGTRVTLLKWLL